MRARNFAAALLIFAVAFAIFRCSPVHQVFDSSYTLFFGEYLLRTGSFSMPREAFPALEGIPDAEVVRHVRLPYQLDRVGDRFFYYFPPGSVVLSVPYVALMNSAGFSTAYADGRYDFLNERLMQRWLAAILMALFAVVVFFTTRLLLPVGSSLVVTAAVAFGTQVWSTASRALWSETWGIFVLAIVVWMILRAEVRHTSYRPVLLATLLSWLYFIRPTFCIPIIGVTGFVFVYRRSVLRPFLLTGASWLAVFVGYSMYHFDEPLPLYYRAGRLTFGEAFEALAGNLFSPSRGLLVYVPALSFVAYLLVRYWRWCTFRHLVWLSLAVIAGHLLVIAGHVPWIGGHGYGPRLTTSLVPWLALLGILAVDARFKAGPGAATERRRRAELVVGLTLVAFCIAIHAVGGISQSARYWNLTPVDVDAQPRRVWEWTDPQFLAPLTRRDVPPAD